MSSGTDYKKMLLIGTLFCMLGAIALAIGMFIDFDLISSGTVDVFGLAIIAFVVGIFFISILTFIGVATPHGLSVNDERPILLALGLFIFAPTIIISDYTTPMFFLLSMGNAMLGSGSIGFYISFIGLASMVVAFLLFSWIFLWKGRIAASSSGGLNLGGSSEVGLVKGIRILTSILIIIAGVGLILGMCVPLTTGSNSLLMYEDGSQLDLKALAFLIIIGGLITNAFFVLLSNLGVVKTSKNELSLLIFIVLLSALPGYTLKGSSLQIWSSPVYELFLYLESIFYLGAQTAMAWIMLIGLLVIILSFFLGILTFFFATSASVVGRPVKEAGGGLEAKKKKGKFPSGPPSASLGGPPSGNFGQSSGPPSASPKGGQPTISSAPPKPPSFLPTASASSPSSSASNPTCPFCGKALRFIDEYSRWYCDTCTQYV